MVVLLATIQLHDLMTEVDHLNDLLSRSIEAQQYVLSKKALLQDEEAQQLIQHFVHKKERFSEAERFGAYHPDYERLKKEMRALKRELDSNASVLRFKKAEKELDKIMAELSKILAYAVSDSIIVPTGNPFFDEAAIYGGCGSGSGCGSGGCEKCGNHG